MIGTFPPSAHVGMDYLDFFSEVNAACSPESYFDIGTNAGYSLTKWPCDLVCVDLICNLPPILSDRSGECLCTR